MNVDLLIEAVVVILLVATCAYCFSLNRRLSALKSTQEELKSSIKIFDDATRRAQENLRLMEKTGLSKNNGLRDLTQKAQILSNELSVMISSGDKIADRIECAVKDVRAFGGARSKTQAPQNSDVKSGPVQRKVVA